MSRFSDKYVFRLQPHGTNNTKATKHRCPQCNQPFSFTRYVYYEDGQEIEVDESCGRCDHRSGCGYHLPPREFFRLHPEKKLNLLGKDSMNTYKPLPVIKSTKTDYIDMQYVNRSFDSRNNLVYYLKNLFPNSEALNQVLQEYMIGATKNKEVIFWQIDSLFRVRTGKIMPYNPYTGHRLHCRYSADWIHARMARTYRKNTGERAPYFNLCQCLFGEHLLSRYPAKKVILVESEKTAIICATVWPEYAWLATGGMNNMNESMLSSLIGRTVVLIPDVDAFYQWKENMSLFPSCNLTLFDGLHKIATEQDREQKIDIGDIVIRHVYSRTIQQLKQLFIF